MRVLVTSTPGAGHAYPMMPLANALRDHGHQVLWAVAEDGIDLVHQHGFEVAVAGMTVADRRAFLEPQLADILSGPPRLRRGRLFAGLFAHAAAPKMVSDLGTIFDRFRPELVVHEVGEHGAAPHAVARGLPHVTVAYSGALPDYAVPMTEAALAPVWESLQLSPPTMTDIAGDVYFHPFAKSMGQASNLGQSREMRPVAITADRRDVPEWIASFGRDRPAVYVTAGTTPIVATLAPWRQKFEALASLDVDVLATIGPQFSVDDLGPIPANVRIERFVAQELILDRVALVVSHAGAGTMLATACAAIPQLLIPTWADQWENADAIARTGAGIMLEENQRDSATIHDAALALLEHAESRSAAGRLAAEILAMPSPAEHVDTLERLAY
jgi:UDP:flavonoid glycosyltransferase YjiC (YdhE family)